MAPLIATTTPAFHPLRYVLSTQRLGTTLTQHMRCIQSNPQVVRVFDPDNRMPVTQTSSAAPQPPQHVPPPVPHPPQYVPGRTPSTPSGTVPTLPVQPPPTVQHSPVPHLPMVTPPTIVQPPPAGGNDPAQVAVSEANSSDVVRTLASQLPTTQHPDIISITGRSPLTHAHAMGALPSPTVAFHTPVGITTAGSGLGLVTPAQGAHPSVSRAVVRGFKVPFVAGLVMAMVGVGLGVVAICSLVVPESVVEVLFPSALGMRSSPYLVAVWGASLLPLSATCVSLKDTVDCCLSGTRGADQLIMIAMVGLAVIGLVTLQAQSLWYTPFVGIVGGLAACGLLATVWIAAHTQGHGLFSLVNPIPRSLSSTAFELVSLGLLGTGVWLMSSSIPGQPSILLGLHDVDKVGSLAVFVGRACGGALVTSGLLCGLLSGTADRLLLATYSARILSGSVAASGLLFALLLTLGMVVRATHVSKPLLVLLLGQLLVGAWALTATLRPAGVQGASRLVVSGRHLQLKATNREPPMAGMTKQQFWEALDMPPEEF